MVKNSILVVSLSFLAACTVGRKPEQKPVSQPPAKVENRGIKEGDLAKIVLTAEAEQRLGIQLAEAAVKPTRRTRTYAGEVLLPPGRTLTVSAPVAGTLSGDTPAPGTAVQGGQAIFKLLPMLPAQRDLRVIAETEVAAARTRLEAAKARKARADRMLSDRVGSVRNQEEAEQELRLADTGVAAAQAKLEQVKRAPLDADVAVTIPSPHSGLLRQVYAASGQAVAAGSPLFEVARLDPVWVRVPVYSGEVASLEPGAPASIEAVNGGSRSRMAKSVAAPPTADALAATSDLYYEMPGADHPFRPGEKISVTLALRGVDQALQVPWSAVLHDIHGGAWVYENIAQHVYARRRVEVRRVTNGSAILAAGPASGARIVTAGAAELFGVEFGAGK